jgi:hypothetical protein
MRTQFELSWAIPPGRDMIFPKRRAYSLLIALSCLLSTACKYPEPYLKPCPCKAPEECANFGFTGEYKACRLPCKEPAEQGGCPEGMFCDIAVMEGAPEGCRAIAARNKYAQGPGQTPVCVRTQRDVFWTIAVLQSPAADVQQWRIWGGCVSNPRDAKSEAECAEGVPAAPVVIRTACGDEHLR